MYGFGVQGYSCIFFTGITSASVDFNKLKKNASIKQLECKENDLKN